MQWLLTLVPSGLCRVWPNTDKDIYLFQLLAELLSDHYRFRPIDVGLAILALSAAALLSIPVQLSTFYMRNFRHRVHHRASLNRQHHYNEGQHPYRTVFLVGAFLVPVGSLAFTISATGPPTHFVIPVFFAGLVAFSGTLSIAECHLIVMDNFDISNLPEPLLSSGSGSTSRGSSNGGRPHGTQRPSSLVGSNDDFTTCHPAITSAFGIFQFVSLMAIAGAVGWSRYIDEGMGIRNGFGIFTGLTFLVTVALASVLWRWKEVRVLEVYTVRESEERSEIQATAAVMDNVRVCKVSILQRGQFTRWSEVNGMVYRGDEEGDAWRVR